MTPDQSMPEPPSGAPKRRGKVKQGTPSGRVLLVTAARAGLVTGLGVVYLYRHLNGNLNVVDVTTQLSNRPATEEGRGPRRSRSTSW